MAKTSDNGAAKRERAAVQQELNAKHTKVFINRKEFEKNSAEVDQLKKAKAAWKKSPSYHKI